MFVDAGDRVFLLVSAESDREAESARELSNSEEDNR